MLGRDPFRSRYQPDDDTTDSVGYRLSGITRGRRRSTAIINDAVYQAGDVIGDIQIMQILDNMVILSDGRDSTVLTLDIGGDIK